MKTENLWNQLKLGEIATPYVIAIVGSGGKTSLMGALAREGKNRNKRVAVLTTTHIRKPPMNMQQHEREVLRNRKAGSITIYGKEVEAGKLSYPGPACYEQICKEADVVLVEADGSRGLPAKVPAPHEPVIPINVNMIIAVSGLSALGQPGADVCHRWELALELLQTQYEKQKEENITERDMSILLKEGYGIPLAYKFPEARFVYCLNQVDTEADMRKATEIVSYLEGEHILLSLKKQKNILYESDKRHIAMIYMASGYGRRFGGNKLLESLQGKPVFQHGLECLREARDILKEENGIHSDIIVVSQYDEILEYAKKIQVRAVSNLKSEEGITASIRIGLKSIEEAEAVLFAVADQPWLKSRTVCELVEEYFESSKGIACLSSGEKRGNPTIFSIEYRKRLEELQGDKGGSQIIHRFPEDVSMLEVEKGELVDIDRRADMKN